MLSLCESVVFSIQAVFRHSPICKLNIAYLLMCFSFWMLLAGLLPVGFQSNVIRYLFRFRQMVS